MLFADTRALETNLQACIAAVARFRPTLIESQGGLPTKKSSPRQLKPPQRPLRAPCSVVMRSGGTSHLSTPMTLCSSSAQVSLLKIREKELQFYTQNCIAIGTQVRTPNANSARPPG